MTIAPIVPQEIITIIMIIITIMHQTTENIMVTITITIIMKSQEK
jgi:hypothetical protein